MRLDQFPSARAHRPLVARRQRRRRGWLGAALRLGSLLVVFAVVALGALAFILASGPVELPVLRDRITETAARMLGPDYRVAVGTTSVDVDPVMGLMVRIDGVRVVNEAGAEVAQVPTARIGIDPLSLLRLRIDITQVEIARPDIALVRGAGGRIYLGTANEPGREPPPEPVAEAAAAPSGDAPASVPAALNDIDGGFPDLFTALHILNGALEPAIEAAVSRNFQRLNIDAATIHIWDARKLQQRVFPHTDIGLTLDESGTIKADFATSGYAGRWSIAGERSVDAATRDRLLSLSFSQLSIADIEPNFGRPESLVVSDIPLFGRANVVLAENGDVKDAQLRFDLGAGRFISGFGKDLF